MRFIRQEHIVTTIINRDISDVDTIKDVLENLLKSSIFFSLILQKTFQSDYTYHTMSYTKSRVKQVREQVVDFIVFNRSALTTIKNISFEDIVEIRAITEKNKILKTHPDISRYGLMDIEEDEEE